MRCPSCGSNDCCGGDVAQQVERLEKEKAELIAAAEEVFAGAGWDHFGLRRSVSDGAFTRLRDVIERIKEKAE